MTSDPIVSAETCDLCGRAFCPNLRADQPFFLKRYKLVHCRHCATPYAIASGRALQFEQHMQRLGLPLPARNTDGTYPVDPLDEKTKALLVQLLGKLEK